MEKDTTMKPLMIISLMTLINYKILDNYDLHFKITNLLDEKYETARDYSQLGRRLI